MLTAHAHRISNALPLHLIARFDLMLLPFDTPKNNGLSPFAFATDTLIPFTTNISATPY